MKDELVEVTQAVNDHCTCAEIEGENPDCALHGVTTAWALENLLPSDWQECVIKLRQRASSPVKEAPADVAETVAKLTALEAFLRGVGELGGLWFGEAKTMQGGRKAAFWWRRSHLPVITEAAAAITRLSADLAERDIALAGAKEWAATLSQRVGELDADLADARKVIEQIKDTVQYVDNPYAKDAYWLARQWLSQQGDQS